MTQLRKLHPYLNAFCPLGRLIGHIRSAKYDEEGKYVHFSSLESLLRLLLAYGHVLLQLDAFLLNYREKKIVAREVCLLSFAKIYAYSSI